MNLLDFSIPPALLAAIVIGLLQPICLLLITRLPGLQDRNPVQFLLSALTALALWLGLLALAPAWRPTSVAEAIVALMALCNAMLVYLEIWGLLSRGYTLGVLLTLYKAREPLRAQEIASQYRGGDGLDWILRHRVAGMVAAGVLVREQDTVWLSQSRGSLVARLYLVSMAALGLRRAG